VIRILKSNDAAQLLARRGARLSEAEAVVRPILDDVQKRGDEALLEYARKFDNFEGASVRLSEAELAKLKRKVPADFRRSMRTAAANIRRMAKKQLPREWSSELQPGLRVGQIVRPLETVAAYVPSGRYPLPSTVLMTVIPAQVAGVPNICVASPKSAPLILGAAAQLGVRNAFQMGGAHAIAAFAFGTATVPRADRIVGPGNIYVSAAKKMLAGETGIDFVAGPTEIFLIAETGTPHHIAADMLAQAEHDTDASAVLLTTSSTLAMEVAAEIESQLETLPTAAVAREAIDRNSAIIECENLDEAIEIANRFAPEHLSIPNASLLPGVRNAGSVFIGPYSPEAAGDYASGPNHVLPTSGAARTRGGLSVMDYVKVITIQELSEPALAQLAPAVTSMARAEGLEAHARSVEVRIGR
jgi:histidinol dehydrogenase